MIYTLYNKNITGNLIGNLKHIAYGGDQIVYQVEVKEHKTNRSLAQNRYYWMLLGQISRHYQATTGKVHSPETFAEYFKLQFLDSDIKEIRGEIFKMHKTTTKLSVGEFAEYLLKIEQYATTELELKVKVPEDYDYAMGIK